MNQLFPKISPISSSLNPTLFNPSSNFKNPLESKLEYLKITHHLNRNRGKKFDDLLSKEIRITPEPNMLLMFPAWLHHKVTENLGDNERISLSFDTILL